MQETLMCSTREPRVAHQLLLSGWNFAKQLTQNGRAIEIIVREVDDEKTLRANRFYWGYILRYISLYIRTPDGHRHSVKAWHQFFKEECLGYEFKMVEVEGRRRKKVSRTLKSTSDLQSRQFANYIERIIAMTAVDYSLEWTLPMSVRDIIENGSMGTMLDPETSEPLEGI